MSTPTIFLSAATLDLKQWRDTLHGAFSRAGFRVLTQDHSLRSAPGDVRRLLAETIAEADCIIHLAGMAYGSHATEPFPDDLSFQCSWTQFEYYQAHATGKDVIAFVCAPSLSETFDESGDTPEEKTNRDTLQQAHRLRVEKGDFVGTPLAHLPRTSNESIPSQHKLLEAVAAAIGTLGKSDPAYDRAQAELRRVKEGITKLLILGLFSLLFLAILSSIIIIQVNDASRKRAKSEADAAIQSQSDAIIADYQSQFNSLRETKYPRSEYTDQFVREIVLNEMLSAPGSNPLIVQKVIENAPNLTTPAHFVEINQRMSVLIASGDYSQAIEICRKRKDEFNSRGDQAAMIAYLEELQTSPTPSLAAEAVKFADINVAKSVYESNAKHWVDSRCAKSELLKWTGQYGAAINMLVEAGTKLKSDPAHDPHLLCRIHLNLAAYLDSLGMHSEAKGLLDSVYDIKRTKLGENHRETLDVISLLGQHYLETEDFPDAQRTLKLCLDRRKNTFGADDRDTRSSRFFWALANLLARSEEIKPIQAAKSEAESMIEFCIEQFGNAHPATLKVRASYVAILHELEEYSKAHELYQLVLNARIDMFGEDSKSVALTKMNGVAILESLGKEDEALELRRSIHNSFSKTLGVNHPITLENTVSLGVYLSKKGSSPEERNESRRESLELVERTLQLANANLGTSHRISIEIETSLARILSEGITPEEYEKANAHYISAYDNAVASFGLGNPLTLNILNSQGLFFNNLGLSELQRDNPDTRGEAYRLASRSMEILKKGYEEGLKFYGEGHVNLLVLANNYGRCLHEFGNLDEAQKIFKDSIRAAELRITAHNKTLLTLKSNLALVLQDFEQVDEARKMLKDIWDTYVASLGHEDRSTLIARMNWAGSFKYSGDYQEGLDQFRELMLIAKRQFPLDEQLHKLLENEYMTLALMKMRGGR